MFRDLVASGLSISFIFLVGCSKPDNYRETVLKNDVILKNIVDGQLPSNLVIAYNNEFKLECPEGEPMIDRRKFSEWSSSEASIGKTHADYMVCLDLALNRQRALLEAHRILQVAPHLPEEYSRQSVVYAASYLAEPTVGEIMDQAIGSSILIELEEAPYPSNEEYAEGRRLMLETRSKVLFRLIQRDNG